MLNIKTTIVGDKSQCYISLLQGIENYVNLQNNDNNNTSAYVNHGRRGRYQRATKRNGMTILGYR